MRYAHPTPENMRRAVNKLSEIFEETRQEVDTPENIVKTEKPVTSSFLYN